MSDAFNQAMVVIFYELESMMIMDIPGLGLVSLMTFSMVCICYEEAMFKIWLKSVEFEGIRNCLKDG